MTEGERAIRLGVRIEVPEGDKERVKAILEDILALGAMDFVAVTTYLNDLQHLVWRREEESS